MLLKVNILEKLVQNARCYSNTVKLIKETLLIQKTTYKTDDWTNINSRFEPFVGRNLYQKRNHPLRLTQDEVITFFRKWFNENIDSTSELPLYKNLDPIESNTATEIDPKVFYVNKDLMLRTHGINREVKFLKVGADNFSMLVDLYRRCQMDNQHFPVFHRMHVFRTMNCEKLLRRSKQPETHKAEIGNNLKKEQQAALIEMAKHLMGTDVKYRWTDVNMASVHPSWMFEIWYADEWFRISGGGLIKDNIFELSERINTAGWEIAIGLDRLAMILHNIFDIRLLWNAEPSFLNRFKPQVISEKLQTKLENAPERAKFINISQKSMPSPEANNLVPKKKKTKCEKHISFIVPPHVDLETFPTDNLCEFIVQNTENAAVQANVHEMYLHPELETYILNVKVEYNLGKTRTKREINNIHESARARAAHKFDLTLRI